MPKAKRIFHICPLDVPEDGTGVPESWVCIDCGVNTAPGILGRDDLLQAIAKTKGAKFIRQVVDDKSEVYTVTTSVWKRARVEGWGGCLCVGCLEKRIGRKLKPKDFQPDHPFYDFPGTKRLIERRGSAPSYG
jgi:hypothetical protein